MPCQKKEKKNVSKCSSRGARSRVLLALLAHGVAHNGKVALSDGVSAVRLVLVHHLVCVPSQDMLGIVVEVLLVHLLPEDGRTAADAAACNQLQGREDCQSEAPAIDGLATHPCSEE